MASEYPQCAYYPYQMTLGCLPSPSSRELAPLTTLFQAKCAHLSHFVSALAEYVAGFATTAWKEVIVCTVFWPAADDV